MSTSIKSYAIVEFLDSSPTAVHTVPCQWLLLGSGDLFSFWPPSKCDIQKLIKSYVQAKSTWNKFMVCQLGKAGELSINFNCCKLNIIQNAIRNSSSRTLFMCWTRYIKNVLFLSNHSHLLLHCKSFLLVLFISFVNQTLKTIIKLVGSVIFINWNWYRNGNGNYI